MNNLIKFLNNIRDKLTKSKEKGARKKLLFRGIFYPIFAISLLVVFENIVKDSILTNVNICNSQFSEIVDGLDYTRKMNECIKLKSKIWENFYLKKVYLAVDNMPSVNNEFVGAWLVKLPDCSIKYSFFQDGRSLSEPIGCDIANTKPISGYWSVYNGNLVLIKNRYHSGLPIMNKIDSKDSSFFYLQEADRSIVKFERIARDIRTLPEGLTEKEVATLIDPEQNISFLVHVDAIPWKSQSDTYVVLACFATTKEIYTAISANHENDFANAEMPFGSKCSGHGDFIRTYLGVVKYKQHEIKPTLVASYGKPLHLTINPMSTNLEKVAAEAPYTDLSNYFGNKTNLYDLVDTDPINITDTEAAISLRFGWVQSTQDNLVDATFGGRALFKIDGNKLVNIFSELMEVSKENKSQRQKYSIKSVKNNLSILQHKTEGHFDIQVKSPLADWWHRTFVWDNYQNKYVPTKEECEFARDVRYGNQSHQLEICYQSAFFYNKNLENILTVRVIDSSSQPAAIPPLKIKIDGNILYSHMDSVSYEINKTLPVFGIVTEAFEECALCRMYVDLPNYRHLDLIMLGGDQQLSRVFSINTYDSKEFFCGKYEESCKPETITKTAIVVISPNQTNGFNDLIVHSKTKTVIGDDSSSTIPKVTDSSARYLWNGRTYEKKK